MHLLLWFQLAPDAIKVRLHIILSRSLAVCDCSLSILLHFQTNNQSHPDHLKVSNSLQMSKNCKSYSVFITHLYSSYCNFCLSE